MQQFRLDKTVRLMTGLLHYTHLFMNEFKPVLKDKMLLLREINRDMFSITHISQAHTFGTALLWHNL